MSTTTRPRSRGGSRTRIGPGRRLAGLTPQGLPGTRTAVRLVLGRMFGPSKLDFERYDGDTGLLGPGCASWQVIAEPAAIAGGLRGLLLQVAHPLAMAGVHDHSAFREDPLGRLQRTSAYITTTTFGSTQEALRVTRIVRGVHPRVHGTAPDGRRYSADDPDLLAWVSIALTSSFLVADGRWSPHPVTDGRADAFVAEQSGIAALLDPRVDLTPFEHDEAARDALRRGEVELPLITDGLLPTTVDGLRRRLADYVPDLGINHQGREALSFLRRPPIPRVARGGYRAMFGGAVASLHGPEARALDLEVGRTRARALDTRASAFLTTMRLTTGVSPALELAEGRATRQSPPLDT